MSTVEAKDALHVEAPSMVHSLASRTRLAGLVRDSQATETDKQTVEIRGSESTVSDARQSWRLSAKTS